MKQHVLNRLWHSDTTHTHTHTQNESLRAFSQELTMRCQLHQSIYLNCSCLQCIDWKHHLANKEMRPRERKSADERTQRRTVKWVGCLYCQRAEWSVGRKKAIITVIISAKRRQRVAKGGCMGQRETKVTQQIIHPSAGSILHPFVKHKRRLAGSTESSSIHSSNS